MSICVVSVTSEALSFTHKNKENEWFFSWFLKVSLFFNAIKFVLASTWWPNTAVLVFFSFPSLIFPLHFVKAASNITLLFTNKLPITGRINMITKWSPLCFFR